MYQYQSCYHMSHISLKYSPPTPLLPLFSLTQSLFSCQLFCLFNQQLCVVYSKQYTRCTKICPYAMMMYFLDWNSSYMYYAISLTLKIKWIFNVLACVLHFKHSGNDMTIHIYDNFYGMSASEEFILSASKYVTH